MKTTHGGLPTAWIVWTVLSLTAFPVDTIAQKRFELKRTKRESTPLMVQLYAGYNGVSNPADTLQDEFVNPALHEWGGLMLGIQALIPLDTLGVPIWIGGDFYYHRMAKRFLDGIPTAYYKSDSSTVHADERLLGYGANLVLAFDLFPRFQLQLGGGLQYLTGATDVQSEVVGLFQPLWVSSVYGGMNFELLKYEHGSIDANLRVARSLGIFGSFQFQSLLGFTFDF